MARKRKGKNTRYQKQQQEQSLPQVPAASESEKDAQGRRLAEQYPGNNLLKNTLRIWKDTAPKGFITFFPVLALFLLYCVLWFFINIILFVPAAEQTAIALLRGISAVNQIITAFGLPLGLSVLHLLYNWKMKTHFYFNAVLYILPACLLYALLEFSAKIIPVLMLGGGASVVSTYAKDSLLLLLAAAVVTFIFGALAQMVLTIRRNREIAKQTKLGLNLPDDDKK